MTRRHAVWARRAVAGLLLGGLAWYLVRVGLDRAGKLTSVLSSLAGVATFAATVLPSLMRRLRNSEADAPSGGSNQLSELQEVIRKSTMSHPGYKARLSRREKNPPSMRVGIRVACSPFDAATPSTTDVRNRLLGLLEGDAAAGLVSAMTQAGNGATWQRYESPGRTTHGAVLAGADKRAAPAAWARLILPESKASEAVCDPQYAVLILHLESRTPENDIAPPVDLVTWHGRFVLALALTEALATFLTEDLHLTVPDDPPRQAGVWLTASQSMTELVDIRDGQLLPGSPPSRSFYGSTPVDQAHRSAAAQARVWITEMCDEALHLDGYEPALASISDLDFEAPGWQKTTTRRTVILRVGTGIITASIGYFVGHYVVTGETDPKHIYLYGSTTFPMPSSTPVPTQSPTHP